MKRVKGGTKVITGKITMNTYNGVTNRIQLFDGKFTTGYRVKDFRICPKSPQNQEEVIATVTSEPRSGVPSSLDFSDNEAIAYSLWNIPNQTEFAEWKLILPNNMAVMDLYIACYTTGDDDYLNYYLELEKYEFTAWDGAGTLVRNQSQSGPA